MEPALRVYLLEDYKQTVALLNSALRHHLGNVEVGKAAAGCFLPPCCYSLTSHPPLDLTHLHNSLRRWLLLSKPRV